jgi:hypothetical protein
VHLDVEAARDERVGGEHLEVGVERGSDEVPPGAGLLHADRLGPAGDDFDVADVGGAYAVFLAGELRVEGRMGDAGAPAHARDPHLGIAALGELFGEGSQQALALNALDLLAGEPVLTPGQRLWQLEEHPRGLAVTHPRRLRHRCWGAGAGRGAGGASADYRAAHKGS